MADPRSNIPELSVSELAFSLKRTLEEGYGRVRVRGELSKVKIHSSGHMYSDLKDMDAKLNIVCWRGTLGRLAVKPEEGLEVICTGKITTYPASSNYQMVVEHMELAGVGALLKQLEERKKRLAAEGLFDESRKKPLPYLPQLIGIVTSPTGAVIRDMLHRIEDRCPRRVLLWPVKVQGEGAAAEIAAAIQGFESLPVAGALRRPDVIIVARGGGSFEDLMPFNEEMVVRAVAACSIPVISAVGHETDTTLIDYAADLRAPTPTAAAEFAVPEGLALLAALDDFGMRALGALRQSILRAKDKTAQVAARLGDPLRLLELKTQQLDHAFLRLSGALTQRTSRGKEALLRLTGRLVSPQQMVGQLHKDTQYLGQRMGSGFAKILESRQQRLAATAKLLDVLSFKATLSRGFVLVRSSTGHVVATAETARGEKLLNLTFQDGEVVSYVDAEG